MIASWMVYALAVGALVTIAALVLERVTTARGWPTRFVWLAALAMASLLPLASLVRRELPAAAGPVPIMPFAVTMPAITVHPATHDWSYAIDRGLETAWAVMSILLLARIALAMMGLRRSRHAWPIGDVDGTAVRLSPNVGPAVIGLRSMDVVLPDWIVSLDAPLRAIVLRHEDEHRRARDPYLLFAAAVAVALLPWNIGVWFAARRLRLAIELDCDQRVLRAHPSPDRYAMLMLTIAQRRGIAPTLFAPMLSETVSQLERRIVAMRTTTRRLARGTALAAIAIAVGALAFACSLQTDTPTSPKPSAAPSRTTTQQKPFVDFALSKGATPLEGSPSPRYPDELRQAKVEGSVVAQFVVDTLGHPDMRTFKVLRSTHPLFVDAVKTALPNVKFSPAEVDGRKVKQLLQMPFEFSLTKQAAEPVRPTVNGSPQQGVRTFSPVVITAVRDAEQKKPVQGIAVAGALPPDVYLEYQVERQASPRPMNPAPRYPVALREAGIEGEVVAQFIINDDGRPDMSSFAVAKSSDTLFTNAVRSSLPNMQFYPAQVGGRPVKQFVQMAFQFNLTKR